MATFLDVLRALNEEQVDYVVVGGIATVLHGHARLTADIDLVVALNPTNTDRIIGKLTSLGYRPRVAVNPADFSDSAKRRDWVEKKGLVVLSFFDDKNPLADVDLFVEYPLDANELWAQSVVKHLGGIPVRVCSIDHLIQLKLAVGRPKDIEDVRVLRIIQTMQ